MRASRLVTAALFAGSMFLAAPASAIFVTLNPSATNVGCTNLAAGACGPISAAHGAFATDNAEAGLVSVLDIAASAGVGVAWTETGTMKITVFKSGGATIPTATTGVNRPGGAYDLVVKFDFAGTGLWAGPTFLSTSLASATATFYAFPATGAAPGIATPSSGIDPTGGLTTGLGTFVLGTATLNPALTPTAIATIAALGSSGFLSFGALFDFVPAAGTTGLGGFFTAPVPFIIDIGASAIAGPLNAIPTLLPGGGVRFTVPSSSPGAGSLTFVQNVPEPATLTLLGVSLLGLGLAARRRREIVEA